MDEPRSAVRGRSEILIGHGDKTIENPGRARREGAEVDDNRMGGDPGSGVLRVRRLDPGLPLPVRAHAGDAGIDLHAAEDVVLEPGHRALVGTGLAVAVPHGYVGLVHPRSGLAARAGISVVNAPGTVDAGYRGGIKVNLVNLDPTEAFHVERGDRIAQLLVQRVELWDVVEVDRLDETDRGAGGHGSTGGHRRLTGPGH